MDENLDNIGLAGEFLASLVPTPRGADGEERNEVPAARGELSRAVICQ